MAERFWFLRVYHGVRHSFPTRWLEWVMALFIVCWGINLLDGQDSFHVADNEARHIVGVWSGLAYWAPDYVWGSACVALGLLRVFALAVNGTFRDTIYSKWSPLARGMSAGLCGGIWFMIWLSAASALIHGTQSQGMVTYVFVFIIDSFISYFVLGEAGDNLRAHRNGRRV